MNLAKFFRNPILLPFRARNGSGSAIKKGFTPAVPTKISFEDQEIVLDYLTPTPTPNIPPPRPFVVDGVKIAKSSVGNLQQISSTEAPQESLNEKYYKPKTLKVSRNPEPFIQPMQPQPQFVRENPLASAKISENVGMISFGEARYEEALMYFLKALQMKMQVLGTNHIEIALGLKKVGMGHQAFGGFAKALSNFEKALAIERKLSDGETNKEMAVTYTHMAISSRDLGDYNKALLFASKALDILSNDQKSTEMANVLNATGTIYHNQGQYELAMKNLEHALDTLSIHYKEDHPMIAQILNNIALVQKDLGNLDEALEYTKRASRIQQRILHKKHADIATTYNYMGCIQYAMGDYEYAKISLKRSLTIRKHVFGKGHKFTATAYNDLGLAHCMLGDYEKALKAFKGSLEIRLKSLEVHHDTATSYYNIAMTYASQEKHHKALEAYKEYFSIEKQLLVEGHPELGDVYNHLGKAYQNVKEFNKALECFVKEAEIKAKVFGEDSLEAADAYKNLGAVYFEVQDYDNTVLYCKRSYDIYAKACGLDSFTAQRLCYFLRTSYKAVGYADAKIEELMQVNVVA